MIRQNAVVVGRRMTMMGQGQCGSILRNCSRCTTTALQRSSNGMTHNAMRISRTLSTTSNKKSTIARREISSTITTKKSALAATAAEFPPPPHVFTTPRATARISKEAASKSILPLDFVLDPTTKLVLPIIGNLSYLALASGFLMTDMLELRLLLVGGYSGLVAFHTLHERPLKIPLRWSAMFVVVNAVAAGLLIRDHYNNTTEFPNSDEELLFENHFQQYLTRAQFRQLLDMARRQTIPADTLLTTENVACDKMYFLWKGQAKVYHDQDDHNLNNHSNATIEQGGFVNDVAFQRRSSSRRRHHDDDVAVAGDDSVIGAYGTVVTTVDSKVLVWDMDSLKKHLATQPEMEQNIHHCMSDHLVKSLLRRKRTTSKSS